MRESYGESRKSWEEGGRNFEEMLLNSSRCTIDGCNAKDEKLLFDDFRSLIMQFRSFNSTQLFCLQGEEIPWKLKLQF